MVLSSAGVCWKCLKPATLNCMGLCFHCNVQDTDEAPASAPTTTNYSVLLEASQPTKQVTVEASSPEEAVAVAMARHCGCVRVIEVQFHATWVGEAEKVEAMGEFQWEYLGDCADCKQPIINREIEGQLWTHASGDEGCYTEICYPCAMKRKEAGTYCPELKRFYKRACCPHDEDE